MALVKACDYCGKQVGTEANPGPFLHFTGSLSEQIEKGESDVQYRFLTHRKDQKMSFCDAEHLKLWIEREQKQPATFRTK